MNVIEREKPIGVIVQFGGQTAINLAAPLAQSRRQILGSDLESIDAAEDRKKFEALLSKLEYCTTSRRHSYFCDQAVVQLRNSVIRFWFVLPMYLVDALWKSSTPMKSF